MDKNKMACMSNSCKIGSPAT